MSNWNTLSGMLQGDVSYDFKRTLSTSEYAEFDLTAFAEKWTEFDIAFEYRIDDSKQWSQDAVITSTTANYLRGNKLYGLTAEKYGTSHSIRWKYPDNNLLYGSDCQVKARMLPRVRVSSSANLSHSLSSLYADSLVDFEGFSNFQCIGIDNDGKYMCLTSTSFLILESLSDSTPLYSYTLSSPTHAININSGNYIVVDNGNSRILEIDATLASIIRTYNYTGSVVFVDYSEENETLLITNNGLNRVDEIAWSTLELGTLIWQSTYSLNSPQCATYKQDNVNEIVIADTGNQRIIKYFGDDDNYIPITYYKISEDDTSTIHEISSFYEPFRAYWFSDGNVLIIEKQGRIIDFGTIESSSSSSSNSSSSSSSSSSSQSSSSSSSSSSSQSSSSSSSSQSSSSSSNSSSSSSSQSSFSSSSSSFSSSSSSIDSSSSSSSSSLDSSSSSSSYNDNPLIFTIFIENNGETFTFNAPNPCDFTIEWGDGESNYITAWNDPNLTHTYWTDGYLPIKVYGSCSRLDFYNGVDGGKVITVDQWGGTGLTNLYNAFNDCYNLTSIVGDGQGLAGVTTFDSAFYGCTKLTAIPSGIFDYCVSTTSFNSTFRGCELITTIPANLFNNCVSVTDFGSCFYNCSPTTIPANLFDSCTSVTDYSFTFSGCNSLTGLAPTLWLLAPEPTGTDCFISCSGLDNWDSIPETWGGPPVSSSSSSSSS